MDSVAAFSIEITAEARRDLAFYTAYERRRIVAAVFDQLGVEPMNITRNRKELQGHPISRWELRVGRYRVFYEVDLVEHIVNIIAIGHKTHNKLWIRGQEVQL